MILGGEDKDFRMVKETLMTIIRGVSLHIADKMDEASGILFVAAVHPLLLSPWFRRSRTRGNGEL